MHTSASYLSAERRFSLEGPRALLGHALKNRYQLNRLSRRGPVSAVFAGFDLQRQQPVTVKVISAQIASRRSGLHVAELAEEFDRVMQVLRRLTHRHTVKVMDQGRDSAVAFLVVERLKGEYLRERLTREGRLAVGEALRFARQTAQSIEEAHSAGLLHRDLRPGNLFVAETSGMPIIKVLDIGLSSILATPLPVQLTATGNAAGEPEYMSPEQARGRGSTKRSDIYAIGLLLFEMLAGTPPFTGRSPLLVMHKQVSAQPPGLGQIDIELEGMPEVNQLLERCLAKDPNRRYQDMRELIRAIEGAEVKYGDAI